MGKPIFFATWGFAPAPTRWAAGWRDCLFPARPDGCWRRRWAAPAQDAPTVIISTDVEDGFFDEVCSYRLEIPDIEDNDDPALEKLEDFFDTFENSLETYCGTTVYNTAQERNTVANVTGAFTAAQDAERLTVHYTLTEAYGDQPDAAVERTRTLVFDVTTGELVEDSAG